MTGRILIFWVLAFGAGAGLQLWNAHLIAKGDTQGSQRVQQAWDNAEATRKATEAQASAQAAQQRAAAEAAQRTAEQEKQKEAERIAHEQAHREQASRAALDAATASNRSLLTTIAKLNADAAARLSGPGAQSCSTTDIDAAARARTALGECSGRYTAVAGVADQLTDQVTGLQDYVRSVSSSNQARGSNGY